MPMEKNASGINGIGTNFIGSNDKKTNVIEQMSLKQMLL
jgi:hypothetical protein